MRLVYLALGWAGGIALAAARPGYAPVDWLLLAVVGLLFTALNWRNRPFRWLNLAALAFALGGFWHARFPDTAEVAAFNDTGGLTVVGMVDAQPDVRDTQTLLHVRAESVIRSGITYPTSGDVLVRAPRAVQVAYGDRVRATGLLQTPGTYGAFSYADYLARQGVFSVMDNADVGVLSSGHGNAFTAWLIDLRLRAGDVIDTRLPEPAAGLLTGILLGNERGISPELQDDFQATGAAHIIAISGFNMVIVSAVVVGIGRGLVPGRRWPPVIAALVVMAIYTLLTGANAAVVRAALMTGLLFVGQALRRRTFVPASLAFVTVLMSAHNPTVLWDVSFQLSFAAVLGLATFAEPLGRGMDALLRRLLPTGVATRAAAFLNEPIVVSLAAQIATTPLIVLYFQRFSSVSLAVNLLIVPVQAFVLFLGGAALLAFPLMALSQALFWLALVPLAWSIGVVRAFADLPFADAPLWVHPRWIALFYVLLIGWIVMQGASPNWWYRLTRIVRTRAAAGAGGFVGIGLLVLVGSAALSQPTSDRLHVWFLDAGHANAVLIQTPDGAQMLVDGGRYPSTLLTALGDRMPFNDRALEVVALTQPDPWDVGAVPAVLARHDAATVITNGQPNQGRGMETVWDALAGQTVHHAIAGDTVQLGDLTVDVLHPQATPTLTESINAVPLVLRLTYGDVSFLLTGDLSADGQAVLLESDRWPEATVMQLPRHGTENALDDAFLEAVSPSTFVLQVDEVNRRGDPDAGTLAALPDDVPLYRTDQGGTVHFQTDGTHLWVNR